MKPEHFFDCSLVTCRMNDVSWNAKLQDQKSLSSFAIALLTCSLTFWCIAFRVCLENLAKKKQNSQFIIVKFSLLFWKCQFVLCSSPAENQKPSLAVSCVFFEGYVLLHHKRHGNSLLPLTSITYFEGVSLKFDVTWDTSCVRLLRVHLAAETCLLCVYLPSCVKQCLFWCFPPQESIGDLSFLLIPCPIGTKNATVHLSKDSYVVLVVQTKTRFKNVMYSKVSLFSAIQKYLNICLRWLLLYITWDCHSEIFPALNVFVRRFELLIRKSVSWFLKLNTEC